MSSPELPWLRPGDPFPLVERAWPAASPAPGLLAAGGSLDVATLRRAYGQGIFPWFSEGQPVLWWSTSPRMVLKPMQFKAHRSLRKRIRSLLSEGRLSIRVNAQFEAVIRACASMHRPGQQGTWIVPEMVDAYCALHAAGSAHSVETWIDGELVAGLYAVALGHAVFGESMFTTVSDGSKIALAALVCLCRHHKVPQIDCQQVTRHLASMGASPVGREEFLHTVQEQLRRPAMRWSYDPVYWDELFPASAA